MIDDPNTYIEEQPGQPEAGGEAEGLDRLAAERDAARVEVTEWRDKYVRLLAEFDNFRKRVRQDSELQRALTKEFILSGLLPIMDDLERMLLTEGDASDPYRRGAELIRDKLQNFLRSHGVERMSSQGKPFDPAEHDALLVRPTADFPPGTVLDVITPGYRIGERVVRHAQVVVSEPAEVAPPPDSPDGKSSDQ